MKNDVKPDPATNPGSFPQKVQIEIKPKFWIQIEDFLKNARMPGAGFGTVLQYYSKTHDTWFECIVVAPDPTTRISIQWILTPRLVLQTI